MTEQVTILTDEQVEDAIWSFFYQLSKKRDRRMTPQRMAGPDFEEAKSYLVTKDNEHRDGGLRQPDLPVVNTATGLPESANDLAPKLMSTSGIKLAMSVIVPPERLAASCVQILPDGMEPSDANWERHGMSLALKPRTSWTEEEHAQVDANALRFKFVIHRLAEEHGYFNLRPIDPNDKDMHDLVWEDECGFTVGFKLTIEGWTRLQAVVEERPHLQKVLHVLDYAGKEIRDQAPQWARDEWNALRNS